MSKLCSDKVNCSILGSKLQLSRVFPPVGKWKPGTTIYSANCAGHCAEYLMCVISLNQAMK